MKDNMKSIGHSPMVNQFALSQMACDLRRVNGVVDLLGENTILFALID